MAEHRKKTASVCVKNGATNGTLELFPASEWGGPDCAYRVRHARKWIDGTHGDMRFFTHDQINALVQRHIFGSDDCAESSAKMPENFTRKTRVSVPTEDGMRECTLVSTEQPFRGHDGRWYVGCHMYGRGIVMVACDDVIIKGR